MKWKRSQQNRIKNAEDRSVGANPESERENNDRGEKRSLAENPKSVAKILHGKLFGSQRDDRIDARRAARRDPGSQKRRDEKEQPDADKNPRIDSFDFEQHGFQRARKSDRRDQTNRRADQEQLHSMRENEAADLVRARAERETNADFADTFKCRVGEQPVEADRREEQRERGKN